MLLQRSDAVQSIERLPLHLVHGFICCYTSIIPEFERLVCCSAHNYQILTGSVMYAITTSICLGYLQAPCFVIHVGWVFLFSLFRCWSVLPQALALDISRRTISSHIYY